MRHPNNIIIILYMVGQSVYMGKDTIEEEFYYHSIFLSTLYPVVCSLHLPWLRLFFYTTGPGSKIGIIWSLRIFVQITATVLMQVETFIVQFNVTAVTLAPISELYGCID